MLASWVQQASFEPPLITVGIGKSRAILGILKDAGKFALAQVPQGGTDLMRRFATGGGEEAFEGLKFVPGTITGAVPTDALSYLECELASHLDIGGDHDLVVGRVVAGDFIGGEPQVHIRKNGFKY